MRAATTGTNSGTVWRRRCASPALVLFFGVRSTVAAGICVKIAIMSSRAALIAIVFALLTATSPGRAAALCTAAEIISQEGGCPAGDGPCVIGGKYTIDDGCTIDFGTRSVTLLTSGRLTIGLMDDIHVGTARIRAGDFIVHSLIDGVGRLNGARGALLHIDLTRNFQVSQGGQIDVSGSSSAGEIIVAAGGSVLIQGQLKAQFLNQDASGGLIDITAGGDFTTTASSLITAAGGTNSDGGGEIDLTAGGNLTVATTLNVEGLDGGFVGLTADGHIIAHDIGASGGGDAGIGGCVDILAGAGVEMQGSLTSRGATGSFMTGGCGGLVCIDGGFGDVTIGSSALIDADGASPDGGGGQITAGENNWNAPIFGEGIDYLTIRQWELAEGIAELPPGFDHTRSRGLSIALNGRGRKDFVR